MVLPSKSEPQPACTSATTYSLDAGRLKSFEANDAVTRTSLGVVDVPVALPATLGANTLDFCTPFRRGRGLALL
jgi:hypothetical protein